MRLAAFAPRHEPAVAITDGVLAAECAAFALLIGAGEVSALRIAFTLFFSAAATAALAGGLVHGWFYDASSRGHRVLWPAALVATGAAAFALWSIAAYLASPAQVAGWVVLAALLEFVGYAIVIVRAQRFRLALANYGVAAAAVGVVLLLRLSNGPDAGTLLGLGALALAVLAAVAQVRQWSLDRRLLDHNTVFHLIQAASFALWFACGAGVVADGIGP